MPAAAPAVPDRERQSLIRLGEQLRLARKRQGVSAVAAAESAGISRVTLHRIERGEPGVAVGSWLAVAGALGLGVELKDDASAGASPQVPARIRLADYPQLRQLAWQIERVDELTPREALELYERNWRHVDQAALTGEEQALIAALARALGAGRLLV